MLSGSFSSMDDGILLGSLFWEHQGRVKAGSIMEIYWGAIS